MAGHEGHYKKYQVYFFLYLAVICELLIVIVERDDAEEGFMRQQIELERKNNAIILELLKNLPAVAPAAENQMYVGETKYFTITVKGLGDKDSVTVPPKIEIMKDAILVETIQQMGDNTDSTISPIWRDLDLEATPKESTKGNKKYKLRWKADKGAGLFEFNVTAGTNRIAVSADIESNEKIKVGNLEFSPSEIQRAIDSDEGIKGTSIDYFVGRSKELSSAFKVQVINKEQGGQLVLRPGKREVVTAVGFPVTNVIHVQGPELEKVNNMPATVGNVPRPADPKAPWVWQSSFNEPREVDVTVSGSDNRGAGALSQAQPQTFKVIVKKPLLMRYPRPAAFIGETFEFPFNVQGLEELDKYSWVLELDGKQVAQANNNIAKFKIPEDALGKPLRLKMYYENRDFKYYTDSTGTNLSPSEYELTVLKPSTRLSASFENKGEYVINQEFRFTAYKCGRCVVQNLRPIPRNELRIEVEADGKDLLDNFAPIDNLRADGSGQTSVRFTLKGRVSKDGTDATIRIRCGELDKTYNVTLYPPEN